MENGYFAICENHAYGRVYEVAFSYDDAKEINANVYNDKGIFVSTTKKVSDGIKAGKEFMQLHSKIEEFQYPVSMDETTKSDYFTFATTIKKIYPGIDQKNVDTLCQIAVDMEKNSKDFTEDKYSVADYGFMVVFNENKIREILKDMPGTTFDLSANVNRPILKLVLPEHPKNVYQNENCYIPQIPIMALLQEKAQSYDTNLLANLELLFPEEKQDQDGEVTIDLIPPNGKDFYERMSIRPVEDDDNLFPPNSFHIKHFTASPATGITIADIQHIKHEFTFSVADNKINAFWMQDGAIYHDLLPPQRSNSDHVKSPNEIKQELNQFVSSMLERTNAMTPTIPERHENAYDEFNSIVLNVAQYGKDVATFDKMQSQGFTADALNKYHAEAVNLVDSAIADGFKPQSYALIQTIHEYAPERFETLNQLRTTEQMIGHHYKQADIHQLAADKSHPEDYKTNSMHTNRATEHIMKAEAMSGRLPEAEPVLWDSKGHMVRPQIYTFQLPGHEDYCGTYIGHGVIDENNKFSGKMLPATDPEKIIPDSEFTTNPAFALKYLSDPSHTANELTGLSVTNITLVQQQELSDKQLPSIETWNTNKPYSDQGQRIAATKLENGFVAFVDIDRCISGVTKEAYPGGNDYTLRQHVMTQYDYGKYSEGIFPNSGKSYADSKTLEETLYVAVTNKQQEQVTTPIYPSLTGTEKQELSNFTAVVKHHFPEAPTDSIHKLCNVASDMKKFTIQNTNGILSNEKYNSLTDSQEKQIKTITDKDLPGTIASLPYDATAPALKLNIPSSVKGYVMSTYTVPEIPKNKLTIAPMPPKTATEIVSKKR